MTCYTVYSGKHVNTHQLPSEQVTQATEIAHFPSIAEGDRDMNTLYLARMPGSSNSGSGQGDFDLPYIIPEHTGCLVPRRANESRAILNFIPDTSSRNVVMID